MATDRILDLRTVLMDLIDDGLLKKEDANLLMGSPRSREEAALHPLTYIANKRLEDQQHPGKMVDEQRLTDWLADTAKMPSRKMLSLYAAEH